MSRLFLKAEQANQQFINYLDLGDAAAVADLWGNHGYRRILPSLDSGK